MSCIKVKVGHKEVKIRPCTVDIPLLLSTPDPVTHFLHTQSYQPCVIKKASRLPVKRKVKTREGEEEKYKVKLILDGMETPEVKEIFVKSKGWEDEEDQTWEPEEHLKGAAELVKKFDSKVKSERVHQSEPLSRVDEDNNQDNEAERDNKGVVDDKEPNSEEKHGNSETKTRAVPTGKGFSTYRAFQGRRIRDHSKKDPSLKCERCRKTFCLNNSLQRHKKKDACAERGEDYKMPSKQPALCSYCGKCFGNRRFMLNHINQVHNKSKKYQCHHCNKVFFDPTNRRRHIKSVHIKEIHICEVCGKKLSCSLYLKEHTNRIHRGSSLKFKNYRKNITQGKNSDLRLLNGTLEKKRKTVEEPMEEITNKQYLGLCNICQAILLSQESFLNHRKKHEKKTGMCPSTMNPWRSESEEEKNIEVNKLLSNICVKCTYCQTMFRNILQLERHWFKRQYCCLQYGAESEPVMEAD